MSQDSPLSYTLTEIKSYLPSGWTLAEEQPAGSWDDRKRSWQATVRDSVQFDWPLEVKAAEASQKGRLEALKAAMDRVYRGRLGPHTRGLGLG